MSGLMCSKKNDNKKLECCLLQLWLGFKHSVQLQAQDTADCESAQTVANKIYLSFGKIRRQNLTLVLLNPDIPYFCKQCRARSVGFWRSQLIWICTVCHSVCEFLSTIWIKSSDWLKIRNGRGILIYSAWQGLMIYKYKNSAMLHLHCACIKM